MGSLSGAAHPLHNMRLDGKAKEGRPVPKAKKEKALKSNLSTGTFHDCVLLENRTIADFHIPLSTKVSRRRISRSKEDLSVFIRVCPCPISFHFAESGVSTNALRAIHP